MEFDEKNLRDYQHHAVDAISDTDGVFKSLILPTGSGKTRVGLEYANKRMQDEKSVAYITQTDAHVDQVLSEASAINVEAVHIPGKSSDSVDQEVLDDREFNIQDYDIAYKAGVFSYSGYFYGSEVPAADVLIIDDAHAMVSQSISYSSILLRRDDWGRKYDRLIDLIKDQNPILKSEIESLEQAVHRGGDTVLVPPPATNQIKDALISSVETMAESNNGWPSYLLNERLNASRGFVNWPCVITADTICWRPFILPFESFGQEPHRTMSEEEVIALTSVKDSEEFLQTRLGTPEPVTQAELSQEVDEMGSRLVIPYRDMYSHNPPSDGQVNVISQWANRFGSILVSTASDHSCEKLAGRLYKEGITPLRYESKESIEKFRAKTEPKALILVNRPSGIDISSSVCPVAIHLDLPYSTSGHEVIAGDIEESGTVADASLAVRLSQLLGRLNRSDEDRSVHILLAKGLSIRKGTVFVKSLDPAVLTDLLIGLRGISREYQLPTDEDLLDEAADFLEGDDKPRERFISDPQQLRERFLGREIEDFSPGTTQHVEANLLAARGNFAQAAKSFATFSRNAEAEGYSAHASFYDFQSLIYGLADRGTTDDVLDRSPEAIIDESLGRNPQSSPLLAALQQMRSTEEIDTEKARIEMRSKEQRRQSFYCFIRWHEEVEESAPTGEDVTNEEQWKSYWRERLQEGDHSELTSAYSEAFELLGTETPQREVKDNDLRIAWKTPSGDEYVLAVEVKGFDSTRTDGQSDLKSENVKQARLNGNKIDADSVLLATSRAGRDREVPETAKEYGVFCIHGDAAISLADLMAKQCTVLAQIERKQKSTDDVPIWAGQLSQLLREEGGVITAQEMKDLF